MEAPPQLNNGDRPAVSEQIHPNFDDLVFESEAEGFKYYKCGPFSMSCDAAGYWYILHLDEGTFEVYDWQGDGHQEENAVSEAPAGSPSLDDAQRGLNDLNIQQDAPNDVDV